MDGTPIVQFRTRIPLLLCLLAAVAGISLSAKEPRLLTLPDTIHLALGQNINLQQSAIRMELGANALVSAEADKQPNLIFSANGSETLSSFGDESIFEGEGDFVESLRTSISSSLTLYDGGGIAASIEAAKADLEATRNDYDRDRQALLLNIVSTFLQAIVRDRQVLIREEELANQEEQLERIRLDYKHGIRAKSEVLRQEALVAQRKGSLIEARRIHQVSLYTLKDLLQIPAETNISCIDPTDTWGGSTTLPDPDIPASLTKLASRLDLEAQKARMDSARQSIRAAESGNNPYVTATANLSTSYNSSMSGSFGDRFFRSEPSASASLSLNLPIFDRRRTETNVLRTQLQLRQEELFYENLLQTARTNLYRSVLNFDSARAQLAAARDQLASADEALEAERSRYEAGVATLLEVNNLRSTRLDAAVAVEQAHFDLFTSRLSVSFEDGSIESFLLSQLEDLDPQLF